LWRAGCSVTGTSGSESGARKRTESKGRYRASLRLYSTYLEGEHCPLAKRGHSRDGKPGQLQIEFGLLTNAVGEPVAIEVFAGNTADPATFMAQVAKVKDRFGVADVVWVGDRGMITGAQVAQLQQVSGVSWVTALRAPTIQQASRWTRVSSSLSVQIRISRVWKHLPVIDSSALSRRPRNSTAAPAAENAVSTPSLLETGDEP